MIKGPLRLLIVDDDKEHQHLIKESIEVSIKDIIIDFSSTGKDCRLKLSKEVYDMLIIDCSLSETSGLVLLRELVQEDIDVPVVMVTAYGNENIAVDGMKLGAYGYIVKTDAYLRKLPATILKVVKEHRLRKGMKEVENKLVKSDIRYRDLIENIIDVVFMADEDLNIISVNHACQRTFGRSQEETEKTTLYDIMHEADRKMVVDYFRMAFLSKREFIEALEFRIKTEKGNIKHVELNAKVNYDGKKDGTLEVDGVIRDITERKKLEQKLSHIDKFNALELQSSGIAHEFNNILGIILGYLNILFLKLKDADQQVLNVLNVIEKAANDGARIVDKVQQFSKAKSEYEVSMNVDIIDIVNEAIEFTMPRWKGEAQTKGVEYQINTNDLITSRYYVRCNPLELREVFVNIINNSLDAMPNGGTIDFSVKVNDRFVVISILDNGTGVKEEIKNKVFDPFFTTKGVKGSGLSMSVAYSIVAKHDGEISIDSNNGKGACVSIIMPLFSEETLKNDKKLETKSVYKGNVLVIEDEEVILEMLKIILEEKGHKVFTTKDANEGIKMYQDNQYDVVLCDLAMPKLNGWKVARYIKDLDAAKETEKTPVILITGYELDMDNLDYRKEGVDYVLKKPLQFEQLNKIINNFIMEKR